MPVTEVQNCNTSLKRVLEDAFNPYPNTVARFEMVASSEKS